MKAARDDRIWEIRAMTETDDPATRSYRNPPVEHRFRKGASGNPKDDRARNAPLSVPKLTASRALDLKIGSNHWRLRRRIGSLQSGKAIE
jgi:hypothetical protein